MRTILLSLACLISCVGPAGARPIVVELFTSEGCSSCPPADALLTELAGHRDLLPLAFHITYWNALGWRDPYSTEAATNRQAAYAGRLGGGSYTPEMVVDGRIGMVGSDRDDVAAALAAVQDDVAAPSVHLSRSGGGIMIAIGAGAPHGRVMLIGFDRQHVTAVGRGENSGRTLVESNVVRSMRAVATYDGAPLILNESAGAGEEIAVLVQAENGRIVGAGRLERD